MTTKYTYILYTGAGEAGGLSEANKAASGGECVGWLRLLLFLFVMTARRNCSSYSVVLSPGGIAWIWRWNRGSDMRWWFAGHLLPVQLLFLKASGFLNRTRYLEFLVPFIGVRGASKTRNFYSDGLVIFWLRLVKLGELVVSPHGADGLAW